MEDERIFSCLQDAEDGWRLRIIGFELTNPFGVQ